MGDGFLPKQVNTDVSWFNHTNVFVLFVRVIKFDTSRSFGMHVLVCFFY